MDATLDSLARTLTAPQKSRSEFVGTLAAACRKAYTAGLRSSGGYPLDPAALKAEYEKQGRPLDTARTAAIRLVDLVNRAYLAGRQDKEPPGAPAPAMHYQCCPQRKGV